MPRLPRRPVPARVPPRRQARARRASLALVKPDLESLLQQMLALPPESRAALAASLLESLEGPPDPGAEAAWAEEIARRWKAIQDGRAKVVAWDEVLRQLQRR